MDCAEVHEVTTECYATEVELRKTSLVVDIGHTVEVAVAAAAVVDVVNKVVGIHEMVEAELGAEAEEVPDNCSPTSSPAAVVTFGSAAKGTDHEVSRY